LANGQELLPMAKIGIEDSRWSHHVSFSSEENILALEVRGGVRVWKNSSGEEVGQFPTELSSPFSFPPVDPS
jgi:hypothetical protein